MNGWVTSSSRVVITAAILRERGLTRPVYPQPPRSTVSRHLQVLRRADLVRDTPIAQFVLYRLKRESGPPGRILSAVLDAVRNDIELRAERDRAMNRSRTHTRSRVQAE